jgi:hypothetical protein
VQVIEYLLVKGGVPAGAGGRDGLMGLAEDGDDAAGPGLEPAGAEFRDGAAAADDVRCALLDAGQPGKKVLVAGVAIGDQVPGEAGRPAGRRRWRPCGGRRWPAGTSAARPGSG